jgi:hypothetical protein
MPLQHSTTTAKKKMREVTIVESHEALRSHMTVPLVLGSSFSRPKHIISTGFHEEDDDPNLTLAYGIAMCIYRFEIATGKTGIVDMFFGRRGEPQSSWRQQLLRNGGRVSY